MVTCDVVAALALYGLAMAGAGWFAGWMDAWGRYGRTK